MALFPSKGPELNNFTTARLLKDLCEAFPVFADDMPAKVFAERRQQAADGNFEQFFAADLVEHKLCSRNYLERYTALLHVGARQRMSMVKQLKHVYVNDSISDVRACAGVVIDKLSAARSAAQLIEADILVKERKRLILDVP